MALTGTGAIRFTSGAPMGSEATDPDTPLGSGPGYWQDADGVYHREAWALQPGVTEYHGVPGATNLLSNPLYESASMPYATNYSVREKVDDPRCEAGKALHIVNNGTALSNTAPVGSGTISIAAQPFTISLDYWSDDPPASLLLQVNVEYGDGTYDHNRTFQTVTPTATRQRASFTYDPARWGHAGKVITAITTYMTIEVGAEIFYARPQIEYGRIPTPFIDPTAPNCGWLGTPNASASYREPWAYGGAVVVEEGTTNLIANPYAWSNASRVAGFGAGTVTPSDTSHPELAIRCARIDTAGSVVNEGVNFQSAASLGYTGTARTFTGRVRVTGAGTVKVWTSIRYASGAGEQASAVTTVTLQPGEVLDVVTASVTTDPAKVVDSVEVQIRTLTVQAITFWAIAHAEEKAYATSFCPQLDRSGNLLPGYAWTGTAHASSSTRAAATVSAPNPGLNPTKHEIITRVRFDTDTLTAQTLWSMTVNSITERYEFMRHNGGRLRLTVKAGEVIDTPLGVVPIDGEFHDISFSRDGATAIVRVDDATYTLTDIPLDTTMDDSIDVGQRWGTAHGDVSLDGMIAFGRPLTDAEWADLRSQPDWTWTGLKAS